MPPIDADCGTPLRQRLDEVKELDRGIERELWSDVQADIVAVEGDSPLSAAVTNVMDEATLVDENDMRHFPSQNIRGTVERMQADGQTSVRDLLGLRSSILADAAEASANGDASLARRLHIVAEGVLDTLGATTGVNADAIHQAREYSRGFNDRWSRDVMGELMKDSARRGQKVADNETMERLLKPGEKGRTNMRALNLAVRTTPPEAKSYILQQFFGEAVVGQEGGFNVAAAEGFIEKYRPTLEETGLLETVQNYVATGRAVEAAQLDQVALRSQVKQDAAASVLKRGSTGEDLVTYTQSLLTSNKKNAQAELTDMFQSSLQDVSGDAHKGLQTAVAEAAVRSMYTYGGDATSKFPVIMTRTLNALEATGQYTPEQLGRIRTMGDIAYRQAQSESQRAFKGQSNTPQDLARGNILSKILKVGMLKYVAPLINKGGPGSMSVAHEVGKMGEKLGEKITQDSAGDLLRQAIFNPQLMAALLENADTLSESGAATIKGALRLTKKHALLTLGKVAGAGFTPSQTTIVPELIDSATSEQEEANGR